MYQKSPGCTWFIQININLFMLSLLKFSYFDIVQVNNVCCICSCIAGVPPFPRPAYGGLGLGSSGFGGLGKIHKIYIVTCQAHPVLVKKANKVCGSFLLKSLAPCLVAARAVCWRPRLAGTRQYLSLKSLFQV